MWSDELSDRIRALRAERLRPVTPAPPRVSGDLKASAERELAYLREFYRHDSAAPRRLQRLMRAINDAHADENDGEDGT